MAARWSDGKTHTLAKVDPASAEYTWPIFQRPLEWWSPRAVNPSVRPGDKPQKLFPESETRFLMTSAPFVIDFQREADGSVKKAKCRNGPEELDGEKIAEADP